MNCPAELRRRPDSRSSGGGVADQLRFWNSVCQYLRPSQVADVGGPLAIGTGGRPTGGEIVESVVRLAAGVLGVPFSGMGALFAALNPVPAAFMLASVGLLCAISLVVFA